MTLVYAAVFGHAFRKYYGDQTSHYIAALFVGLSVMSFFSNATSQAMQAVVSNGMLLNKMQVPSLVFPVSTVVSNAVQLVVGTLPAVAILGMLVGHGFVWLPLLVVPFASLFALALGVALVLSALYVFFRDIPYLYELTYFAVFVATPIFYPLAIVEERYRPFIAYSPLTMIVESIRAIVVNGTAPDPLVIIASLASSLAILTLGFFVFRSASRSFMDYL